jgi:hypothetical protein
MFFAPLHGDLGPDALGERPESVEIPKTSLPLSTDS